ncbi:hypothetical protein MLD38_002579 [Melastoma candidum]|uniref:Uncharacterized protein n=1 Tax=Melastoma candidum TaxID=119954 RepID=A0ACB9RZI4_9MYRT|nr:hypothetical protein MLD38_002579 [Melastoma candidum]
MESQIMTQLPEVGSLPDGFVDSALEPTGPQTPLMEQEKPPSDTRSGSASWSNSGLGSVAIESETDKNMSEISSKMREFYVTVPECETRDDMLDLANGNCDSRGTGGETSAELPGRCEVEEQAREKFQNSERSSEEELGVQTSNIDENLLIDGDNLSRTTKKQESAEIKRKSSKPGFKSEKEFLQFTLSYQQVIAERDAAISVRDKLESLCRELQRQNKMLMDECKQVSTEGQNLRLDLSAKFQDVIKEVSSKLEQQKIESISQLKENEMLKINLKQLADQYTLSEKHNEQQLKQKSLELQIADLKLKQHEEKFHQGQSQMKVYAEQISQLMETEKNLRSQLTADGEKFLRFQDALSKSNEVFETFKQEIEKMAKSMKDLKKENAFLKSKCERTDLTIIELVEDRERTKKQMEKMKNQKEKLESLCRSLQAKRKQNAVDSGGTGPISS